MTATVESSPIKKTDDNNTAPYNAGLLLCELLEAVEVVENHVRLGDGAFTDPKLTVAVLADHAQRIRKQALTEDLVRPLSGDDGSAGLLSIGEALMDADASVYRDEMARGIRPRPPRAFSGDDEDAVYPSYTKAELADAVRTAREVCDRLSELDEGSQVVDLELDEKLEAVLHFF